MHCLWKAAKDILRFIQKLVHVICVKWLVIKLWFWMKSHVFFNLKRNIFLWKETAGMRNYVVRSVMSITTVKGWAK